MTLYGIPAGYASQRQSLLYGPAPTATQYGGVCAAGAVTGLVISAFGVGELTLGLGSLAAGGIGCLAGIIVTWGSYEDENLSLTLQSLDTLNNYRDLLTTLGEWTQD